MRKSGLGTDILRTIWNLADFDGDGYMNKYEFAMCMYLCDMAVNGQKLPKQLKMNWRPKHWRVNDANMVRTYWIDYMGTEELYSWRYDINGNAAKEYTQQTFVTHPWKIADAKDRFIGMYVPKLPNVAHGIDIIYDGSMIKIQNCYAIQLNNNRNINPF